MSQAPAGYQAPSGYPPQPGYAPQQGYGTQQATYVAQPQQQVVGGNCQICRVGNISDNYTVLGIVLAIIFFPIGILCCVLMTEKKCDRCGATI